ncbi:hypothetical protein LCGC14_0651250 [marine sediment metagenome]|uniref:Uncharacterized protein n=1 Tax=marine sediment metagenome TaxID=412755 RepID=A0A0F9THZ9_9ZZZZ
MPGKEIVEGKIAQDLSVVDFEDVDGNKPEDIESTLQMQKWETEPEAVKEHADINKDTVLGNLDNVEMVAINLGEEFITSMTALRSMMNDEDIAEYFFPKELILSQLRAKASILALSNSKEGFLRKLKVTRQVFKGYGIEAFDKGMQETSSKIKWNPFTKTKK